MPSTSEAGIRGERPFDTHRIEFSVIHTLPVTDSEVQEHFRARATRYDHSSHWVADKRLAERVRSLLGLRPRERILDVACGTGLWALLFRGHGREVIGVDVTPAMYRMAREKVDALVDTCGENLPFRDDVFDIATVRQGIQFMDAARAVREMVRVTRPGGRLCLVQLCAYGSEDQEEYFEILRLRNPARRNFFLRQDLQSLLQEAGCTSVVVHDYISTEDVEAWADHGAIDEQRREAIRQRYRDASDGFKALHAIEVSAGHFLDRMLFGIAVGVKAE